MSFLSAMRPPYASCAFPRAQAHSLIAGIRVQTRSRLSNNWAAPWEDSREKRACWLGTERKKIVLLVNDLVLAGVLKGTDAQGPCS
jgi:hypothetical protein